MTVSPTATNAVRLPRMDTPWSPHRTQASPASCCATHRAAVSPWRWWQWAAAGGGGGAHLQLARAGGPAAAADQRPPQRGGSKAPPALLRQRRRDWRRILAVVPRSIPHSAIRAEEERRAAEIGSVVVLQNRNEN